MEGILIKSSKWSLEREDDCWVRGQLDCLLPLALYFKILSWQGSSLWLGGGMGIWDLCLKAWVGGWVAFSPECSFFGWCFCKPRQSGVVPHVGLLVGGT